MKIGTICSSAYLNLIILAVGEWGGGLLLLMSIGGQGWHPTIISSQLPTGLQHRRYNSHLQYNSQTNKQNKKTKKQKNKKTKQKQNKKNEKQQKTKNNWS